jgi:protein-disulfide isomerase-like protein with CxxC motif
VPDRVRFYFDPLCPWCYQTSRWVHRLVELGELEVSWGVFSLEIANAEDGADLTALATTARAASALRSVVTIRDAEGDDAVARFYRAIGAAIHERGEDAADRQVLEQSLEEAGLSATVLDKALGDATTWDAVISEHHALVDRTRSFGVPTIALDDGDGPAIFGPVICDVPDDEDAVALWQHVAWLTRYENFSELKRDRPSRPDLESVRRHEARRA